MSKVIDKLAWLYVSDGKLLVARSKDKVLFYVPGGKREIGETDQQALIREVKEEVSVDLLPESIKYAATFTANADGKSDATVVQLTCYFAEYEGVLKPDAEIAEIDFIDYQNIACCSAASILVMDWLKSNKLI
ncbi:MAG: NUDIX domain-containing protein [Psychromonas sp.]